MEPVDGISVLGMKFKSAILTDRLASRKLKTNHQYMADRDG